MQTDDIFYRIFQSFPSIFFDLVGNNLVDPDGYSFKSIQVKQTKLTMDGLFAPSDDRPTDPLFFIEVQFQTDLDLYYRLMAEIHLYLRQYKPARPWQAVVFFPKASIDKGLPVEYEALDGLVIRRIYLDSLRQEVELPPALGVIRLVIEPTKTAQKQARHLITQTRQEIQNPTILKGILELIQTILVYKFPTKSRTEIEAMFGLTELKQTKVYQEAQEEEALSYTMRLLTRRFKSIPSGLQDQIGQLTKPELETLGEAVLDFSTEADLVTWLEQRH